MNIRLLLVTLALVLPSIVELAPSAEAHMCVSGGPTCFAGTVGAHHSYAATITSAEFVDWFPCHAGAPDYPTPAPLGCYIRVNYTNPVWHSAHGGWDGYAGSGSGGACGYYGDPRTADDANDPAQVYVVVSFAGGQLRFIPQSFGQTSCAHTGSVLFSQVCPENYGTSGHTSYLNMKDLSGRFTIAVVVAAPSAYVGNCSTQIGDAYATWNPSTNSWSAPSNWVNITNDQPPGPVTPSAEALSYNTVRISWTPNIEADLNHYVVRVYSDPAFTAQLSEASIPKTQIFTDISGLAPLQYVYVQVYAFDNGGQLGQGASVVGQTCSSTCPLNETLSTLSVIAPITLLVVLAAVSYRLFAR